MLINLNAKNKSLSLFTVKDDGSFKLIRSIALYFTDTYIETSKPDH